ncbi:MAG: hypothetical protein Q6K99_07335 [Thermostichales cyanobacterium BF4_bins_65]
MPILTPEVIPIDPIRFAPYGQMITAVADGKPYDEQDAQLVLDQGIPRFYIMGLVHRGLGFHRITRHRRCSQCLGSLGGEEWFLGVAPPRDLEIAEACPDPGEIVIFQIPGTCFVKLHPGTWHAGPYFTQPRVDFYNLELADTNITDHHTCDLQAQFGLSFQIVPPGSRHG